MPTRKKHAKQARKAPRKSKEAKSKQLTPGQWFEKLVAVQARLRAPNGCPWDREQTHRSLRTYLIEEAYEVLEALESGNDAKFAEEMGDLLLQIVFHSQIAREEDRFPNLLTRKSLEGERRRILYLTPDHVGMAVISFLVFE